MDLEETSQPGTEEERMSIPLDNEGADTLSSKQSLLSERRREGETLPSAQEEKEKKHRTSSLQYNVADILRMSPPLDYSFKKANNLEDIFHGKPQVNRTHRVPFLTANKHYKTHAMWLSYNNFITINGIEHFVSTKIGRPELLYWLDLSFNRIDELSEEIVRFPNLMILYLHGNAIRTLTILLKLLKLANLKKLTLHGNPLEVIPNYRGYMIRLMPYLESLDFTTVTVSDRNIKLPVYTPPFNVIKQYEKKLQDMDKKKKKQEKFAASE